LFNFASGILIFKLNLKVPNFYSTIRFQNGSTTGNILNDFLFFMNDVNFLSLVKDFNEIRQLVMVELKLKGTIRLLEKHVLSTIEMVIDGFLPNTMQNEICQLQVLK